MTTCPHCGFGPGFSGTPECRQNWAGDPRARPQYPLCMLKEDVSRAVLDGMAERYVKAHRHAERAVAAVRMACRYMRDIDETGIGEGHAHAIETAVRDLLDAYPE